MNDNFKWLGKKDEVDFEKVKFKGKLAGKSWKYSQSLDRIIAVRITIFAMTILVFYPIVSNYFFHDVFTMELFIERIVFALILLFAGLIFNKYRIAAILIATIPLILILLSYILIPGQFDYRKIGFTTAILLIVLSGIYQHFQLKNLKKELEETQLENHLVDNNNEV